MESATIAAQGTPGGAKEGDKGLKAGALSSLSNLVIGVASTAPGYSLAATLGFIVDSARMIAVGSHGESPLKGAVLGSTPYKLVHASRTPVLVVRP